MKATTQNDGSISSSFKEMASEPDVELIRFAQPGDESRLYIPEILWPAESETSEEELCAMLDEKFSPYGPLHSVYAARCDRDSEYEATTMSSRTRTRGRGGLGGDSHATTLPTTSIDI